MKYETGTVRTRENKKTFIYEDVRRCACGKLLGDNQTLCSGCQEYKEYKSSYKPAEGRTEFRICQRDGCETEFVWSSRRHGQKYCSPECAATVEVAYQKRNRWVMFDRDGHRCNYCGKTPLRDPDIELHLDHIVPRVKGGADTAGNLITSCGECNSAKCAATSSITKELLDLVKERNSLQGIHQEQAIAF